MRSSKVKTPWKAGPVASSAALKLKSPTLRAQSQSSAARQSQSPAQSTNLSPKLIKLAAPVSSPTDRDDSDETLTDDPDDFPTETRLPWMLRLDELQAQLTSVWREQRLLDVSVLSTFADAQSQITPTIDIVASTRALMDAGFDAFQAKLRRQKELQEKAIDILEEIRRERARHPASEFSADVDPKFDPDLVKD
jgi:hypothetical protein